MFDADNHSNGTGLKIYKEHGGSRGVLSALKTSEERGIRTGDEGGMRQRTELYGTNAPRPVKIKTLCQLIKEQLDDQTLKILIVSCIASLAVGIWQDVSTKLRGKPIVSFFPAYH